MACTSPLKGWCAPNGGITFAKKDSHTKIEMQVPCGQCTPCRLARSREWASRLVKEAMYWRPEETSFITLTYAPEYLPKDESINVVHFQKFMKRLRKHFTGQKIKYFHCGEYGTECKNCKKSKFACECGNYIQGLGRPHYHAIIYGVDWDDKQPWKTTKAGSTIYRSPTLEKLWVMGHSSIGDLTFESCAYVSRYIMKKINGKQEQEGHYIKELSINHETGEIVTSKLTPEYITMSRNPAIAKEYFYDFMQEIANNDSILLSRKGTVYETKPPRYFDKQLEKQDPTALELIKTARLRRQRANKADNTPERCEIKAQLKQLKMSEVTRDFEDYHE